MARQRFVGDRLRIRFRNRSSLLVLDSGLSKTEQLIEPYDFRLLSIGLLTLACVVSGAGFLYLFAVAPIWTSTPVHLGSRHLLSFTESGNVHIKHRRARENRILVRFEFRGTAFLLNNAHNPLDDPIPTLLRDIPVIIDGASHESEISRRFCWNLE